MCRVLSVKKSSYFSWTQIDHIQKDQTAHEDYQLIETAFFNLKENALETLAFGIVNFALMFWAIFPMSGPEFFAKSFAKAYAMVA